MITSIVKLFFMYALVGSFVRITGKNFMKFVHFFFWVGLLLIIFGGIGPKVTRLLDDIHNASVFYTQGRDTIKNGYTAITTLPEWFEKIPLVGVGTSPTKYPPALTIAEKTIPFKKDFFIHPVSGEIRQGFNPPDHHGLDYAINSGTIVRAARKGVVQEIGEHDIYGYFVLLDHGGQWQTLYAHMSEFGVKKGQNVFANDGLGLSGGQVGAPGAGNSEGPHLHFEIRTGGKCINPIEWMK